MEFNTIGKIITATSLVVGLLFSGATFAQGTDNCADAVAQNLIMGGTLTLTGNNTAATFIGDFAPGSPYAGTPVVWHKFTVAQCTQLSLSYCGQSPAWTGVLGILTTDCPGSGIVNANSFSVTECGDGNSTFNFNSLAPGTYNVPVILNAATGASGAYSIVLAATACNNDFCGGVTPIPIAVGSQRTFVGNNATATPTGDFVTGNQFAGAPVNWHAFKIPYCARVKVSYCGISPTFGNTFGVLAQDCPGDDLINFTTFNTTECGDGNYTFVYEELPAGTYNFPVVMDAAQGSTGPYSVVVKADPCNNDNCANVAPVPLTIAQPISFIGNNTNASATNDFVSTSNYAGAPVVWHAFTSASCFNIAVSYCGQNPAWGNVFGFFATSCPADQLVFFNNNNTTDCGDGNYKYFFTEVPPGTYLVPVVLDPGQNSVGAYNVGITATACAVGINEVADAEWLLYPNPAVDELVMVYSGANAKAQVQLMDLTGRVVMNMYRSLTKGDTYTFDLPTTVTSGTYLFRVVSENGGSTKRVVIQ